MLTIIPIWALLVGLVLLFLGSEILGERVGERVARRTPEAARGYVAVTAGAVLGLLALLLGFSFSMAVGRFELRREMVVTEANAIGTTWLRASMLRTPHDTAVRRLLGEYVAGRMRIVNAGDDAAVLAAELARAEAIQDTLWRHAEMVAVDDPRPAVVTLFTSTLNELIDVHAIRVAALRSRVPEPILLALILTATLAVGIGGYAGGLADAHQRLLRLALAVLFATLITLVADLDRPRTGVIRTPQDPMLDLQRTIHAAEITPHQAPGVTR